MVALIISIHGANKTPTVVKGINGNQGQIGPQGPRGDQGVAGPMGPRGFTGAPGSSNANLSSIPGNFVGTAEFNLNGVNTFSYRRSLGQSTTTVCAIQAPTNATSTLIFASLSESVSTTTASIIDFARATTAFATTTLLNATVSVAAGAQVQMVASTSQGTITGLNNPVVFPPASWFVVKQNGDAGLNVSPVGTCQAQFKVL